MAACYRLRAVLLQDRAHMQQISDFNSQFHISLAHLTRWKMDRDGSKNKPEQDGETRHVRQWLIPAPLCQGHGQFCKNVLQFVE